MMLCVLAAALCRTHRATALRGLEVRRDNRFHFAAMAETIDDSCFAAPLFINK